MPALGYPRPPTLKLYAPSSEVDNILNEILLYLHKRLDLNK
jgi:hypothetical protein